MFKSPSESVFGGGLALAFFWYCYRSSSKHRPRLIPHPLFQLCPFPSVKLFSPPRWEVFFRFPQFWEVRRCSGGILVTPSEEPSVLIGPPMHGPRWYRNRCFFESGPGHPLPYCARRSQCVYFIYKLDQDLRCPFPAFYGPFSLGVPLEDCSSPY